MRHISLAVVLSVVLIAGVACAAPAAARAREYREVPVDRNGDTKIDGVDIYNEDNKLVRQGYDDDGDGMNDRYLDYDPNTGMPMVTASDQEFGD